MRSELPRRQFRLYALERVWIRCLYVDIGRHAQGFLVGVQNRLHAVFEEFFCLAFGTACEVFRLHDSQQLFFGRVEVRVCRDPVKQIVFCAFFFDALAGSLIPNFSKIVSTNPLTK